MIWANSSHVIVLIFSLIFLLFFTIACDHKDTSKYNVVIDESILQEGDLVFRLGRGTSSQIVHFADKENSYSHIGLLVKDSIGWCVIHAVPGESDETGGLEIIKCDPVARFFDYDRTVDGVIMRFDSINFIVSQIVRKAKELYNAQILFDHQYLLSDTTTMYCTEFIHYVFLSANVDLSEGRRHSFPLVNEMIIFPSDILWNKALREVCKVEFSLKK